MSHINLQSGSVSLNPTTPEYVSKVEPFEYGNYIPNSKNMALDIALSLYRGPVGDLISHMRSFLSHGYKYYLVDVKVHDLYRGDVPCIPGWHVDGGPDVPSEYVLCVAGSSLTDFYTTPIDVPYHPNTVQFCASLKALAGPTATLQVPEWTCCRYTNLNPHRGSPARMDGQRLLVRVMGSDKIQPQAPGNWRPTLYRAKKISENT